MFISFGLFSFLRNNLSLFIDDIISPFVTQGSCFISFFLTLIVLRGNAYSYASAYIFINCSISGWSCAVTVLNNRVRFCSKFLKLCKLDSLYDLMVIVLGFGLSIIF